MAALKAYLDDSGDDTHAAIAVAGYIGTLKVWHRFEPTWNAALKRHDIPYFHMSEIPNPKSHMHKFCGRDGADKLKALLADLVSALATSSVGNSPELAELCLWNHLVGSIRSDGATSNLSRWRCSHAWR